MKLSTASPKTSWKVVGDAPIVARISPTLSVSGLRKVLGHRLSYALKPSYVDEQSIMNQVALTSEVTSNSKFEELVLGSVTYQLSENPKTPFFANPWDSGEMDLVANIVEDHSVIDINWPKHLDSYLDKDALSAKDIVVAKDVLDECSLSAKDRAVTIDIEEEIDEFVEEEIDEFAS